MGFTTRSDIGPARAAPDMRRNGHNAAPLGEAPEGGRGKGGGERGSRAMPDMPDRNAALLASSLFSLGSSVQRGAVASAAVPSAPH
ncbi:unnamed protein product [Closterium sp. Naga37s-1]|nr:unnamed protein product [Closterium sp. Naga37s-1]